MPRGISLAALLVLASGTLHAGTHVPDWMRQAAAQPIPALEPHIPAVVLLREESLTAAADGKIVHLHREVKKLLGSNPQGEAELAVPFDSLSSINLLRAWTITADGRELEAKAKDVVEGSAWESFVLYSDQRYKVIRAAGAESGSVVAFEYETLERPYRPDEIFLLQQYLPVLRQRISIHLPSEWEYRASFVHMTPLTPAHLAGNGWQWELGPMPAVHEELLSPNAEQMSARMSIAFFGGPRPEQSGDWRALGRWYGQLSAGRTELSPEARARAAQLVAGRTSFVEQVRAIANFLQDQIRYVEISIGVGNYQPHAARDVFEHRYGDCKDKATLLIAMLESVGIHAHYLLVDFDRRISPEMPASIADHMIVAIDLPDGVSDASLLAVTTRRNGTRELIFDPTDQYLAAGQLGNGLQGSYGVLFDDSHSELIRLPTIGPADSVLKRQGNLSLTADGVLKGEFQEDWQGPASSRYRAVFAQGNPQRERTLLENQMRETLGDFTLDDFQAEHVGQRDQPLLVHYALTAGNYAKSSGSVLLVRPHVLGSATLPVRNDQPRQYPVELPGEHSQIEDYTLRLPEGYKVEDVPDPVSIDTDFASYNSRTEVVGNSLHYTRQYQVKALELPANRYGELTNFERMVANDERTPAILRKIR